MSSSSRSALFLSLFLACSCGADHAVSTPAGRPAARASTPSTELSTAPSASAPPSAAPAAGAPAPTAPAGEAAEKVTKLPLKKIDVEATERLIANDCNEVLVSPDGKTVVYVNRDHDAYAVGSPRRLAREVQGGGSSFAPDGRSLILRTMLGASQNGVVVLQVPGLERIYASDAAEHVHYRNAATIIFHEDGVPKSLDVASRKVTTLGPKLPGFACPDEEMGVRKGTRALEAACPSKRWTRVVGADEASGRFILADLEETNIRRVRLVDPKTGEGVILSETSADSYLEPKLSRHGDVLCITRAAHVKDSSVEGRREVRCGPVAKPDVLVYSGTESVFPSFFGPGRVAINRDLSTRIIELGTGAVLELAAGRKRAFYQGWQGAGRDAYTNWEREAVWVDLESGTWATLGPTGRAGSLVAIDPADRRRAFVTHFEAPAHYRLYEVRWK